MQTFSKVLKAIAQLGAVAALAISAGCAIEEAEPQERLAEAQLAETGAGEGIEILVPNADGSPGTTACVLYANRPYRTTNWIEADGGRVGCSDVVNIHVRIRHDRPGLPDNTLAETFVTAANYDAHLSFPCFGWGSTRTVFTEVIVNGQKVQSPSPRPNLPCD